MQDQHSHPHTCWKHASQQSGFTLIELIAVVIILGLVSSVGASFIVSTFNSYDRGQKTAKLVLKGRLAMEQMTRQLRNAVPNSLRISASGNCLEFLPALVGGHYIGELPDVDNGGSAVLTVPVAPVTILGGSANHFIVGALLSNEIYQTGSPSARAAVASVSGSTVNTVNFSGLGHLFLRNSVHQRYYLADDPLRFCLAGTDLFRYSAYGLLSTAPTDAVPSGAATDLMAQNVAALGSAFALSSETEDRAALVTIGLNFAQAQVSVDLRQDVLVRNVP